MISLAIVELRDEMVLQRTQKILSQMGQMYDYEFSPAVGGGVKERYAFLYKQNLVSVVRKVEIIFEDGEPAQPLEYRHGWIIPPEWEFISEVTEYERRSPVSEIEYDHESEVGIIKE